MNVKTASENVLLRFALQAAIGLLVTVVVGLQGWELLKLQTMSESLSSHTTSIDGIRATLADEHAATTKQLDYVNSIILQRGAQRDAQLTAIQISAQHGADQTETLAEKFDDLRKVVAEKWAEDDNRFEAIWTAISRVQAAVLGDKGK